MPRLGARVRWRSTSLSSAGIAAKACARWRNPCRRGRARLARPWSRGERPVWRGCVDDARVTRSQRTGWSGDMDCPRMVFGRTGEPDLDGPGAPCSTSEIGAGAGLPVACSNTARFRRRPAAVDGAGPAASAKASGARAARQCRPTQATGPAEASASFQAGRGREQRGGVRVPPMPSTSRRAARAGTQATVAGGERVEHGIAPAGAVASRQLLEGSPVALAAPGAASRTSARCCRVVRRHAALVGQQHGHALPDDPSRSVAVQRQRRPAAETASSAWPAAATPDSAIGRGRRNCCCASVRASRRDQFACAPSVMLCAAVMASLRLRPDRVLARDQGRRAAGPQLPAG